MNLQTLHIRIDDVDAFRAITAMKTTGETATTKSLQVMFNTDGQATEVFNTDTYGIVFAPVTTLNVAWTGKPAVCLNVRLHNHARVPARVHEVTLDVNTNANGELAGVIYYDGTPGAFATVTTDGAITRARHNIPANPDILPVAPPAGFDTLHVAGILRAMRNPPNRSVPIRLPMGGYGFHWRFDAGGEFVMASLRGTDDEEKRFRGILDAMRERTPF